MMFRVPAGRAGEPRRARRRAAVPGQRRLVLRDRRRAARRRRPADDLGAGCRPSAAETRSSTSSSGPRPSPARGQVLHRRPALRDLRLRPARAPPLRRAGRGDGRGRLRRLHALRSAGRVRSRVLRRGRRARPRLPQDVAAGHARRGAAAAAPRRRECTRSACRPPRPAPTPSRWSSRSRSHCRCRTGCRPTLAALTEPMAVGWHAVRRGEVKKGTVAIVIGCGPVGLAVISLLKAQRGAHRRRERLLAGPAGAGGGVRRRRGRRPGEGLAVRGGRRITGT